MHVWKAASDEMALSPGALRVVNRKLYAGCGQGSSIQLREVQLEGKRRMQAEAFLNGFTMNSDEALQ